MIYLVIKENTSFGFKCEKYLKYGEPIPQTTHKDGTTVYHRRKQENCIAIPLPDSFEKYFTKRSSYIKPFSLKL